MSPNQSVPWSIPKISPVSGSNPYPIVFRSPEAKIVLEDPSGAIRSMVAFSGFVSAHALHVDPAVR